MKNVNIVFIDNIPSLSKAHFADLHNLLNQLQCADIKEQDNMISFSLGECSISTTYINIEFSRNPKDGSMPEETRNALDELSEQYRGRKTLFVIDLCLDKAQIDSCTGKLVKDILIDKQQKRNHGFLYITGVFRLNDDKDTLIRAITADNKLDNTRLARAICKFYPQSVDEEKKWEEHYSDVLSFMRSNCVNIQFWGAILLKAIKLTD